MSSQLGKGLLTNSTRQTWVQTDRKAHEAWGRLIHESPRAASLLHTLVAHMDESAAVVCSYKTLSYLSGMAFSTVRRAIADLKDGQWIQVIQIGGKGGGLAFVVNSRVAWAAKRDHLGMAVFSAKVLAISEEQDADALDGPELRRIPTMYAGERQLPTGPGEDPPSQPSITGLEPDLPSRQVDPDTGEIHDYQKELEKRGQQRLEFPVESKCGGGDGVKYTECESPKLKAVHVGQTYSDSRCENCGGYVRHSWD